LTKYINSKADFPKAAFNSQDFDRNFQKWEKDEHGEMFYQGEVGPGGLYDGKGIFITREQVVVGNF